MSSCFKSELEGDSEFIENDLLTSSHKLDSQYKLEKYKQVISDANQMRHIRIAWSNKIRTLGDISFKCGDIENQRADVYLNAVAIVEDLNTLCMTYEPRLIMKEKSMTYFEMFKQSHAINFNDITNFTGEEIRRRLISFVSVNEEYSS